MVLFQAMIVWKHNLQLAVAKKILTETEKQHYMHFSSSSGN